MPWSKECVEHLRAVHFTLIIVATGLIVLVLSAKKYDSVRALAELEEILELKSQWSPASVANVGDFEVKYAPPCTDYVQCYGAYNSVYLPETDLVRRIVAKASHPGFPFHDGQLLAFKQPTENWSTAPRPEGVHWSPSSFPNTLAEFRRWWNDLGDLPYEIDFPREIGARGGRIFRGNEVIGELRETDIGNDDPGKTVARFPTVFVRDDKTGEFSYISYDTNKKTQIFGYEIPVTQVLHVTIRQQLISAKFQSLVSGKFEDSFADLQSATSAYQNLQLMRLESFIKDDASKGSEVFEALGVKFPADQIVVWGIVVLLGIQIYYFASLKSLSKGPDIDPTVRAIPWLGMNADLVSQSILFVTTVLIPLLALAVLIGRRANLRWSAVVPTLWSVTGAGDCLLLLISALLAIGAWVYRPRLESLGSLADRDRPGDVAQKMEGYELLRRRLPGWRRWLLLYKPPRTRAWIPRVVFYIGVLMLPLGIVIGIAVAKSLHDSYAFLIPEIEGRIQRNRDDPRYLARLKGELAEAEKGQHLIYLTAVKVVVIIDAIVVVVTVLFGTWSLLTERPNSRG
jgi:hypothetical protein